MEKQSVNRSLVKRLQEAICSGSVEELKTLLAEVDSWQNFLLKNDTMLAYMALDRGDHAIVECLLQEMPTWAWTKQGMEAHGRKAVEGGIAYAVGSTVRSETFQLLLDVLGKEWTIFEELHWRRAEDERVEEILAIWGDLARGAGRDDAIRAKAMEQFFSFVEYNVSFRGCWLRNSFAIDELQKGGDALFFENFRAQGGWNEIVRLIAGHPADEVLSACLASLRDEDFAELGSTAMAACFTHRPHVLEGMYEKFPRDGWTGKDRVGDSVLPSLSCQYNAEGLRYMTELLGQGTVKKMIDEDTANSETYQSLLHYIAQEPAPHSNERLEAALDTVRLLIEIHPTLTGVTTNGGDTFLHYAARATIVRSSFSITDLKGRRSQVDAFCEGLAKCCTRDVIAQRNDDGDAAVDLLRSSVPPQLRSILTVAVKGAGTS